MVVPEPAAMFSGRVWAHLHASTPAGTSRLCSYDVWYSHPLVLAAYAPTMCGTYTRCTSRLCYDVWYSHSVLAHLHASAPAGTTRLCSYDMSSTEQAHAVLK
eukprot:1541363-Rhodomonas_salina.5